MTHDLMASMGGTTTQGDDHVRLEGVRHLGALAVPRTGWVGFHFVEDLHFHVHFLEQADYFITA